jgi:hypothetical protein
MVRKVRGVDFRIQVHALHRQQALASWRHSKNLPQTRTALQHGTVKSRDFPLIFTRADNTLAVRDF